MKLVTLINAQVKHLAVAQLGYLTFEGAGGILANDAFINFYPNIGGGIITKQLYDDGRK
ncbi:MAG: hypothetical protein ABL940_06385 [Bacteroidia bacterium]